MAQYTILIEADVKSILGLYNIADLVTWKILSGGSTNTNYYVETSAGKYVLTFCEEKSYEEAKHLSHLLEYLKSHDFSTSTILLNKDGNAISIWNGTSVMLKDYLIGQVVEDLPNQTLFSIGEQLAQLHSIPPPAYLPHQISYGEEHFQELEELAPNHPFTSWLKQKHIYIKDYLSVNLPKALIHSDLFYNNIIVEERTKSITIMDLEEATFYYRIFDIGMAIVGSCSLHSKVDLTKVQSLLNGYRQTIELNLQEKKALKAFSVYGATATAFWRFKNFNFTNPNPTLFNHYKKMALLADDIFATSFEDLEY